MTQKSLTLTYQAARLRALGKRRGGPWLRARIWNWEFKAGQWDFLQDTQEDSFYALVETKLERGRLLDLGCGSGTVRCEMPTGSMSSYVGVDISAEAIRQAEQRAADLVPLPGGQHFVVGSITDPQVLSGLEGNFDVILMRECLYFVDLDELAGFFASLCELLSPRGVILIRIWEKERYAAHVDGTRSLLRVIEEYDPADKKSIFMVATRPTPV